MGIKLNKFEDNVMYVASTPGNSLETIREFVESVSTILHDAEDQIAILWDGRTGTYNGPLEELVEMANLGSIMLPKLKKIAVVVASDHMKGITEALKVFTQAQGIQMIVSSSFKTAHTWIAD